jgi:putative endonuclease
MDIRKFLPLRATSPTQRQGREAEARAQQYLEARGLRLVAANYRCRHGEIDLIMRHGEVLVFIEVRERKNSRYGGAAASVTRQKQEKIIATAQHFLQHQPEFHHAPARFDVLALNPGSLEAPIDWLQAAFTL